MKTVLYSILVSLAVVFSASETQAQCNALRPLLDLGPDIATCDSVVTLDVGFNYSTILWDSGATTRTRTVTVSGIYWVEVSDTAGNLCRDSVQVTINPHDVPVVVPAGPVTICADSTVELDAFDPDIFVYRWFMVGDTNSLATSADLMVSQAGTYFVVGTNGSLCSDTSNFVIVDNFPDQSVNLGVDTGFCAGSSFTIDAGAGFTSYLWSDSAASTTQTITVTGTGGFFVDVVDTNGCPSRDTLILVEYALPTTNIGNDTSFCDGGMTTLDAGPGFTAYAWTGGPSAQTLDVSTTGAYQVTVTDDRGCEGTSNTVNVTVNAIPAAPTITFESSGDLTGPVASNYVWSFNGTTVAGATNQTYTPTDNGTYGLIITDANGCVSPEGTLLVVLDITRDQVPEGFSPNGDGINDTWQIFFLDAYPNTKLQVFNRHGQIIFETDNYQNNWDGKTSDGKELPDGTYFYLLTFPERLDPVQGYVIINR